MKKITYSLFLFAFIFFSSCSEEYDDTELRNDITDLENRVQALEELCKNMNTNISSLQTLVDALQSNDYITNITPIISEGKEIGYNIEFLHHEPIAIYHGKDGQDGKDGINGITPQLKIENNYWYISYDNGNSWQQLHQATMPMPQMKIENDYWYISYDNGVSWQQLGKATGENGIIPQLKIVDGYWYVSYDNGKNWQQLDKATGEDGKDGQTPQFKIQDNYWYVSYDGGTSWVLLQDSNNNSVSMPIFKIEDGYWLVSYDAGSSWNRLGKAQGDTGEAGNTPQFKIENDYWYVSYDNGSSWQQLGRATGNDGSDGLTPKIGVKKDTDGIYYWTLDGDWLLDDDGQKIKAQGIDGQDGQPGNPGEPGNDGQDGKDGITPQLKIEDGYWYVSYDNRLSWTKLGKATGEDGANGDSMFESIDTTNKGYVIFRLSNGEELKIQRSLPYDIYFDKTFDIILAPNSTIEIPFEISYSLYYEPISTKVEAIGSDGIKVEVIKDPFVTKGKLKITSSDVVDETSKVVVFLMLSMSNQTTQTITKVLTFEEGVLNVIKDVYDVDSKGGQVIIPLETNMTYSYTIEESAKKWITPIETRSTHTDKLTFKIAENRDSMRIGTITFVASDKTTSKKVAIKQTSGSINGFMTIQGREAIIDLDAADNSSLVGDAIAQADKEGVVHYRLKGKFKNLGIFSSKYYESDKYYIPKVNNPFMDISNVISIDLSEVTECDSIPSFAFSAYSYAYYEKPPFYENDCGIRNNDTIPTYYKSLRQITLPQTIKKIGIGAFAGCTNLKYLNIPSVEHIPDYAFYMCKASDFLSVDFSKVQDVGARAFYACSSLSTINISECKKIDMFAFANCTSLKSINMLKAETIGDFAFKNCISLLSADLFRAVNIGGGVFYNCESLKSAQLPIVSEASPTPIIEGERMGLFANCKALSDLCLDELKELDEGIFENCISLKKLKLPKTRNIKKNVFKNLPSLEEVDLLILESIEENLFYKCGKLSSVKAPKVTTINVNAFRECISLKSTYFPIVVNIGDNAFMDCTSLNMIKFPEVTTIGNETFNNCTSLRTIELSNVTNIGKSAFGNCESLISLNLPKAITIEDYTFNNCISLESLELSTATMIGEYAFSNCKSLTSIKLPISTEIKNFAFNLCSSLTSIDLPKVIKIGNNTFNNCSSLTSINLPMVTTIGNESFNNCSSLTSINLGIFS